MEGIFHRPGGLGAEGVALCPGGPDAPLLASGKRASGGFPASLTAFAVTKSCPQNFHSECRESASLSGKEGTPEVPAFPESPYTVRPREPGSQRGACPLCCWREPGALPTLAQGGL